MRPSLADIPITEETRAGLQKLGVSVIPTTELAAQAVLAMHADASEDAKPRCFAQRFAPEAPICLGCIVMPQCWSRDLPYLRKLQAGKAPPPPLDIPKADIETAVARAMLLPVPPPPPSKRSVPPPPPPPPPIKPRR